MVLDMEVDGGASAAANGAAASAANGVSKRKPILVLVNPR